MNLDTHRCNDSELFDFLKCRPRCGSGFRLTQRFTLLVLRFECAVRPDFQKWIDIYEGKEPDWKGIFTHPDGDKFYKATVDYPACGLYNKLLEQYPDAKVPSFEGQT